MRRPSPAVIIAFIALLGAWGGPAVAQSLIGSKHIKDASIRGRDIRANTITGRHVKNLTGRDIRPNGLDGSDIDEETLDQVPSAMRADTAKGLEKASLNRVAYAEPAGSGTATLFEAGGLRVQASCAADGTLVATADAPGATGAIARASVTRPGGSSLQRDDDFGGADTLDLVDGGATGLDGRLTYWSPNGDVITLQYLAQDGLGASRTYACALAGTAVHVVP